MHKKVIVSYPLHIKTAQRNQITEKVNHLLSTINEEINSWNGFVDYVESEPGYFVFIAKCDNEEVREMMQLLLDEDVFNPEARKEQSGGNLEFSHRS